GLGAAVDGAVAGDDAVAVGAVGVEAEVGGAAPGELVQFDEGALVEQEVDPFTCRQLALGVLLLDGACGAGVRRLFDTTRQIRELARGRVYEIRTGLLSELNLSWAVLSTMTGGK